MIRITPYRTVRGAVAALDNGGRFYNLFVKAGDQVVDASELARAAGVHSADSDAFIYFEMALMELAIQERDQVRARLAPELAERYEACQPTVLAPSEVTSQGQPGASVIVSGYPMYLPGEGQLRGVFDLTEAASLSAALARYDLYALYESPGLSSPRTLMAVARGSRRLGGAYTSLGGILREAPKTSQAAATYLEAKYYLLYS